MTQGYQINTDWKRIADQIVIPNQRVLVLGASDTGKTTFCRYLIDAARTAALKVALVDADIGQSQIGPPTTVGMKLYESADAANTHPTENKNLETDSTPSENKKENSKIGLDSSADAIYFVGTISPPRNLLPILTGTRLMVDAAIDAGADFIIIDTTGYVHDGAAVMLKQQKIELICPNHIVCVGRSKELERIIGSYHNLNMLTIHYLLPHKLVRTKSSEARKRNRETKFNVYFEDAEIQAIPFEQIKGARTPFFNGRMANEKELEILSGLTENEVVHAEWGQRTVSLIARRKLTQDATIKLKDYLSLNYVVSEITTYFEQRLVGMIDGSGATVAVGIIENVDFEKKNLLIRCKTGITSDIKVLQIGNYRLDHIL